MNSRRNANGVRININLPRELVRGTGGGGTKTNQRSKSVYTGSGRNARGNGTARFINNYHSRRRSRTDHVDAGPGGRAHTTRAPGVNGSTRVDLRRSRFDRNASKCSQRDYVGASLRAFIELNLAEDVKDQKTPVVHERVHDLRDET